MHLSKHPVNLRSRRRWPEILTAVAYFAGGSLMTGCIIVEDDDHDHHGRGSGGVEEPDKNDNNPPAQEIMEFSIDTDKVLESPAGEGIGLFVEYAAGGTWRLWTTCDTNYSNVGCKFDVIAAIDTGSKIDIVEGSELEGYDEVEALEDGSARLYAETASDFDVMTLTTTPGSILRVDLQLDGAPASRFIYWVGNGILHEGAPTNPVDFKPSSP